MSNHLQSAARQKRRANSQTEHNVPVKVILPVSEKPFGILDPSSEVIPTDYNQQLPRWRWHANISATQEHWKNWQEYQLASIGSVLGLFNILYFPFNTALNGYGAYLIAYIAIEFLIGFPIVFLQMAVGQYTSKDTIAVFTRLRLAQGVGISCALLTVLSTIQSAVKLSWILFFMFSAFNIQFSPLHWDMPWRNCSWTSEEREHFMQCSKYNADVFDASPSSFCPDKYFHDVILGLKGENVAHFYDHEFNWALVGCLFIVYLTMYAFVSRGIRSVGKVLLIAVPVACICLVIFLLVQVIRSHTVGETAHAVKLFVTPRWEVMRNIDFWFEVTRHVLFSLNLEKGTLIVIGSYARFQSATHYHAFYVCLFDMGLSLLFGISLCIAYHTSHYLRGLDTDTQYLDEGIERNFFITISSAVDDMKSFPPVWLFIFFSMIFMLGVMREVAVSLVIFTPFYNKFPNLKKRQHFYNMIILLGFFVLSLPFVTMGRIPEISMTKLFMYTPTKYIQPLVTLCSISALVYLYGLNRLRNDIEFMLHFYPNKFFAVMWTTVPIILLVEICAELFVHNERKDCYRLSKEMLWFVLVVVILPIPAMAVFNVIRLYRKRELRKLFYHEPCMLGQDDETPITAQVEHETYDSFLKRHGARSTLTPVSVAEDIRNTYPSEEDGEGGGTTSPLRSSQGGGRAPSVKTRASHRASVTSREDRRMTLSPLTSDTDRRMSSVSADQSSAVTSATEAVTQSRRKKMISSQLGARSRQRNMSTTSSTMTVRDDALPMMSSSGNPVRNISMTSFSVTSTEAGSGETSRMNLSAKSSSVASSLELRRSRDTLNPR